jgi:c-di-GMP-binding flagellar brake protein YcgR
MAESVANNESAFILRARGDIVEKLRLMERKRSVLSVTTGDSGDKLSTVIVKVLADRGLVGLDVSTNPAANRRLLQSGAADCETMVQGVEAHFRLRGIQAATLNGEDLIAAEIPDSLFWLQRRSYYRVVIPPGRFLKCRVTLPNGEITDFSVLNVSLVGIALLDSSKLLWQWGREGQLLGPCWLRSPGMEEEEFALEVRNKVETTRINEFRTNIRVGLAFRGMGHQYEIKLQKLIFELEREWRRETDGLIG